MSRYCSLYLILSPCLHPLLLTHSYTTIFPHAHHTLCTPVIEPLPTYFYSNTSSTHHILFQLLSTYSCTNPHQPLYVHIQPLPTQVPPHPSNQPHRGRPRLLVPYMKFTELSQQKLYTLLQKIKSPDPETITVTSGRIYTPSTFLDEFLPIIIQWKVQTFCFYIFFRSLYSFIFVLPRNLGSYLTSTYVGCLKWWCISVRLHKTKWSS